MRRGALALAVAVTSLPLAAQQSPPLPAPLLPPITAIRAGTLIDGTGAAPVRNVVIVVQGERLVALGPSVSIPPGATIIDLAGETVLPGFIDAHVHLVTRTVGDGACHHAPLTA